MIALKPMALSWLLPLSVATLNASEWRPLFNGNDLAGWKCVIAKLPPGEDPDKLVQVRDGSIHMYADTDPATTVPFGVIVHDETFSRFHLSLEYRWGGKKFAPRKNDIRDAGLLYHSSATDKVWPDSVEYQIQEGDSGDIVFIPKAGLTWMRPDPQNAPEGLGEPGMLPEQGGIVRDFAGTKFAYVGRFPELDTLEGWNRVEIIVHADETAEHVINGQTISRISHLRDRDGSSVREGKLALQLEGAEILYRDIKIRELAPPLQADRSVVSLSGVHQKPSRKATLVIKNPTDTAISTALAISGSDAKYFTAAAPEKSLEPGKSMTVEVEFSAPSSPGRFSAGLQVGDRSSGVFVILQGIGLAAFEGKNEPALQSIVHALGIPLNVGGDELQLDTTKNTIGQSIASRSFRASGDGKIRITPLARFSPPGEVPFGIALTGGDELTEIGRLADVSDAIPDAHQSLFPPLANGAAFLEINPPAKPFAFFMEGHKFTAFTDPEIKTKATIRHTARVYPVQWFGGRQMKNCYLVGFEEASNGDYQDTAFLVENITPVD